MSSDSGLFSHSLLSWSIDDLPFSFTSIIVLSDTNSSRQCLRLLIKLSLAIEEIRQAIQKSETIAVDCEGVELSHFGSVTFINIAVSGQVYLIDVLKIGNTAYDGGLMIYLSVLLQSLFYQTRTVLDNV
jgi:hypothetical protein